MIAAVDLTFFAWLDPESLEYGLQVAGAAVVVALVVLLPLMGLMYATYFFFSLPMRRRERVRMFLDLVEIGLGRGQSPENTIVSLSRSRDSSLGARFHLLAAHLESGLRLGPALDRVPRLLPPPIVAMLKVGESTGDLGKVLPACRCFLRDGASQMIKAQNYLIILLLLVLPSWTVVGNVLLIYVLPKMLEIFRDLGITLPALLSAAVHSLPWLMGFQWGLALLIYLGAVLYVGGPRVVAWLETISPEFVSGIFYRIPWRRLRMQRDFSAMLAVLLDAGMPEAEAIRMAAECTTNRVFQRRALAMRADLREGAKLTEALNRLPDAGEFQWRLANALQANGGFALALSGWHETLEARAYRLEQAFAQVFTTALVFFNGLMVATLALIFFQPLIWLLQQAVLW